MSCSRAWQSHAPRRRAPGAAAIAGIPFGNEEDEPTKTPAEIEQEWRAVIRVLQSQVDELRLEVRNLSDRIVIPLGPE